MMKMMMMPIVRRAPVVTRGTASPLRRHLSVEATQKSLDDILEAVHRRDPHLKEFHQVVEEMSMSLKPVFEQQPEKLRTFERMLEPENVVTFRVPWTDDRGNYRINRGFRVQYSQALGPYKGGLRFHPTVDMSVMKFLALEQVLKNSLTGLNLGGAKGGSDFNPKGKSDNEVMRFCQSFMTSLFKYIGPNRDIPAGDIGVGGREIGFLFGQYRKMTCQFEGVITGKGEQWGGSLLRPEATGYGAVYFLEEMLAMEEETIRSKKVAISGSGNVATFAAEKLLELGVGVVSLSDSSGFLHFTKGLTKQQLEEIIDLKEKRRGRLSEFSSEGVVFYPDEQPWRRVQCDVAMPSATQNEITKEGADALLSNGARFVVEGANMPLTLDAHETMSKNGAIVGPAKAANAGGVTVSGLEMSQNGMKLSWTKEEVDEKLRAVMKNIYDQSQGAAKEYLGDGRHLTEGANIAGFMRVAKAMEEQGCV